ncbi:MAG: bifunctional DNA primase/polymerase, partial [Acidobacteriota bacterium]|nr:bifunctional DNA primase/polymerase [Acidobacteriota bacterium]
MLPSFERAEDMPPGAQPKESQPMSLSEYAEQRRNIMLAENRRVHDRLCDGALTDVEEIDARIATLEVHYSKALHELKKSFESTRDVLTGLRSTRLVRAMDFTDPLEAVAPVDEILAAKGIAGVPLSDPAETPADWLRETIETETKGAAGVPLSAPSAEDLSDDFEEVVIGDAADASSADSLLSLLDCALKYAALGLPVFPLKPNKKPYTEHGFKDASTDPVMIRARWRKHKDAGIGVPTGKASGWFVLDVDVDKGGDASLSALIEQHGDLPPTLRAKSGGGGDHFYFTYPADSGLTISEGKLGKGLDTRGEGGYIVVAPTVHPSGSTYRWANTLEPAPLPRWIVEALLSEKHEPVNTDRKAIHYPVAGARHFAEGERNAGLRDLACGWWRNGLVEDEQELYERLR